jgi:hypothetical protein
MLDDLQQMGSKEKHHCAHKRKRRRDQVQEEEEIGEPDDMEEDIQYLNYI